VHHLHDDLTAIVDVAGEKYAPHAPFAEEAIHFIAADEDATEHDLSSQLRE